MPKPSSRPQARATSKPRTSTRRPRPARPPRLDTRLPASKLRALRKLLPCTDSTRSKVFDLYIEITDSIRSELQKIDPDTDRYELLSPARRRVVLIDTLEAEINNGGFEQYYDNSSGDGAALVPTALRDLGQTRAARIVERANAQFPSGPPRNRDRRGALIEQLGPKAARAWDKTTDAFYKLPVPLNGIALTVALPHILEHESEFFKPA